MSHEEAATVSGTGWFRTITRIVTPANQTGLLAAWMISFILAFGELGVSILVAPPGEARSHSRLHHHCQYAAVACRGVGTVTSGGHSHPLMLLAGRWQCGRLA